MCARGHTRAHGTATIVHEAHASVEVVLFMVAHRRQCRAEQLHAHKLRARGVAVDQNGEPYAGRDLLHVHQLQESLVYNVEAVSCNVIDFWRDFEFANFCYSKRI